jgi:hypothetical protein
MKYLTQNVLSFIAGLQHAQYFLKKIELGPNNYYFWKQMGKELVCTCAGIRAAWLYNETWPLGWSTLKPMPKEERVSSFV